MYEVTLQIVNLNELKRPKPNVRRGRSFFAGINLKAIKRVLKRE